MDNHPPTVGAGNRRDATMKEFVTALKAVEDEQNEDDGAMHFTVDGRELTCYPPSDGQLAILIATTGRHTSQATQVAGVVNFFVEVMDEPSHAYLVDRLLDRTDPFGIEEVEAIMSWMIEEWTGRPTQSPSVSTRSPKRGGPRSTRRTSALTSSGSPSTGS